jgi:hypothetical protein
MKLFSRQAFFFPSPLLLLEINLFSSDSLPFNQKVSDCKHFLWISCLAHPTNMSNTASSKQQQFVSCAWSHRDLTYSYLLRTSRRLSVVHTQHKSAGNCRRVNGSLPHLSVGSLLRCFPSLGQAYFYLFSY